MQRYTHMKSNIHIYICTKSSMYNFLISNQYTHKPSNFLWFFFHGKTSVIGLEDLFLSFSSLYHIMLRPHATSVTH